MKKNVLVTRPPEQSAGLVQALQLQGFNAITLPLMRINAFSEHDAAAHAIRTAIQHINEYDHIIFISTNSVELGFYWIERYWPQLPLHPKWYAIGRATAAKLGQWVLDVEENGEAMNSESLLMHPHLLELRQQKVLIVRGVGGRSHLREQLEQRGAEVRYCEVYQRESIVYTQQELTEHLEGGLSLITVSSGETLQLLLEQAINDGIKESIQRIPLVAPGRRVSDLAKQLGFLQVIEAENASVEAMVYACK